MVDQISLMEEKNEVWFDQEIRLDERVTLYLLVILAILFSNDC